MIASGALIAASFGASAWVYGVLPEWVPTHFGIDGVADGYMYRPVAAVFIPTLCVAITAGMRYGKKKMAPLWIDVVSVTTVVFMTFLHGVILANAVGQPVDVVKCVLVATGVLLGVVAVTLRVHETRAPWMGNTLLVLAGTTAASPFFGPVGIISSLGALLLFGVAAAIWAPKK